MKRFFRKALIWLARVAAILIVLIILFYAEEDWRGARDWATCQKELQAKGEILDLRQLVPPGKPEDDLSKVPIFAEEYRENRERNETGHSTITPRINRINVQLGLNGFREPPPSLSIDPQRWLIDLSAWQKFYRSVPESRLPAEVGTPAEDVLQALSQYDPELKELDAAVSNPNAYWPNDAYFLEPWDRLVSVAEVARLEAAAHLENHHSDLAEQSFLFSLRLARPLTKSGLSFAFDFQVEHQEIAESILWEGLHDHAWTAPQLQEMEQALASTDMLTFGAGSFRVDRANFLESTNKLQNPDPEVLERIRVSEDAVFFYFLPTSRLRPSGWWNEERNFYCRSVQSHLEAIKPDLGKLLPAAFPHRASHEIWEIPPDVSIWNLIYTPVASECIEGLDSTGTRIARAETYRRLARLACRLEVYRLAHGSYPDKLDDLPYLPTHLNQEVLSDQPFRYQRMGDSYQLYSVGWSQKDNGGVRATDDREGDWPWRGP
jgi:hypothetical protein